MPRIALVGDSVLDNAYWIKSTGRHIQDVRYHLQQQDKRSTVFNFAVDETVISEIESGKVPGYNYVEKRPSDYPYPVNEAGRVEPLTLLSSHSIDVAIVSAGGNDARVLLPTAFAAGWDAFDRVFDWDAAYARYEKMVISIKSLVSQVILVALYMPTGKQKTYAAGGNKFSDKLLQGMRERVKRLRDDIVKPIAEKHGCKVLDLFDLFNPDDTSLYAEAVEPSNKGGKLIAGEAYKLIYSSLSIREIIVPKDTPFYLGTNRMGKKVLELAGTNIISHIKTFYDLDLALTAKQCEEWLKKYQQQKISGGRAYVSPALNDIHNGLILKVEAVRDLRFAEIPVGGSNNDEVLHELVPESKGETTGYVGLSRLGKEIHMKAVEELVRRGYDGYYLINNGVKWGAGALSNDVLEIASDHDSVFDLEGTPEDIARQIALKNIRQNHKKRKKSKKTEEKDVVMDTSMAGTEDETLEYHFVVNMRGTPIVSVAKCAALGDPLYVDRLSRILRTPIRVGTGLPPIPRPFALTRKVRICPECMYENDGNNEVCVVCEDTAIRNVDPHEDGSIMLPSGIYQMGALHELGLYGLGDGSGRFFDMQSSGERCACYAMNHMVDRLMFTVHVDVELLDRRYTPARVKLPEKFEASTTPYFADQAVKLLNLPWICMKTEGATDENNYCTQQFRSDTVEAGLREVGCKAETVAILNHTFAGNPWLAAVFDSAVGLAIRVPLREGSAGGHWICAKRNKYKWYILDSMQPKTAWTYDKRGLSNEELFDKIVERARMSPLPIEQIARIIEIVKVTEIPPEPSFSVR